MTPTTLHPRISAANAWLAPLAGAGLLFLLYFLTAAPGAWWGDGLEFACAAKTLGVPHPPGYPLYMILGWGWLHLLPWVEAGRALTLLSALCCAMAAAVMGRVVAVQSIEVQSGPAKSMGWVARVGVVALLGLGRGVWEHATFAEVYPLALLLVSGIVALAVSPCSSPWSARRVVLLGSICGLCALHHYSLIIMAPLAILTAADAGRDADRRLRPARMAGNVALLAGVSIACLAGYLYLPLRARANPPINWGDPTTFARVLWVMRGGDFVAQNTLAGASAGSAVAHGLAGWARWWGGLFVPDRFSPIHAPLGAVLLGLALVGCLKLARRRAALGCGLALALILDGAIAALYRIPDPEGYFLVALPAAAVGWTELGIALRSRAGAALGEASLERPLWKAAPGLLALALAAMHGPAVNKAWDEGPDAWSEAVLRDLPPNAIVLTAQGNDNEIYGLWHAQIVRGLRPDVSVFGTGFIFKSWYARSFESVGKKCPSSLRLDLPAGEKAAFDVALAAGVILPNLADHAVFATFEDEFITNYFSPRPVRSLLPAGYYEATALRLAVPHPILYRLGAQETRLKLPPTQKELRDFFAQVGPAHLKYFDKLF